MAFFTDGNLLNRRADPMSRAKIRTGIVAAPSVCEVVGPADCDRADRAYILPSFSALVVLDDPGTGPA